MKIYEREINYYLHKTIIAKATIIETIEENIKANQ
jgi:hypothetical protein